MKQNCNCVFYVICVVVILNKENSNCHFVIVDFYCLERQWGVGHWGVVGYST